MGDVVLVQVDCGLVLPGCVPQWWYRRDGGRVREHGWVGGNWHTKWWWYGGMGLFDGWCDEAEDDIGDHSLRILRADESRRALGVDAVAKAIPEQYVSNSKYADVLAKLGKKAAAKYLRGKLPMTKAVRSGELGEVLALTFVEERTRWGDTVKKLRWKDHRDMPMRGDDVLAIRTEGDEVSLLKGEAKSRGSLSSNVLKEAQKALKANEGRPSPHALTFYAEMLADDDRTDLADKILGMQYKDGIPRDCVSHMIFSFSGNDPENLLRRRLGTYKGKFEQLYVGVRVMEHGEFIESVYQKVGKDGDA